MGSFRKLTENSIQRHACFGADKKKIEIRVYVSFIKKNHENEHYEKKYTRILKIFQKDLSIIIGKADTQR